MGAMFRMEDGVGAGEEVPTITPGLPLGRRAFITILRRWGMGAVVRHRKQRQRAVVVALWCVQQQF